MLRSNLLPARRGGGAKRRRGRALSLLGPPAICSRSPRIAEMVQFKGKLTPTPRGGGGCLVPVPRDVATKLGLKGMPKIQAVIAGQPYRGSLMPLGDGTWCLGVLKSIQEAAGVGFGDTITVELTIDTAPRTVEPPPDLARAIGLDK